MTTDIASRIAGVSEWVLVRSTVHLPGLPVGRTVLVDPSDPYVASCLAAKYLVRVETDTSGQQG